MRDTSMSREITHTTDPDDGHLVQVVSADRLREILDANGDNYERPADFAPDDEWFVGDLDDEEPPHGASSRVVPGA